MIVFPAWLCPVSLSIYSAGFVTSSFPRIWSHSHVVVFYCTVSYRVAWILECWLWFALRYSYKIQNLLRSFVRVDSVRSALLASDRLVLFDELGPQGRKCLYYGVLWGSF